MLQTLTSYMHSGEPRDSARLRAAEMMGKHYGSRPIGADELRPQWSNACRLANADWYRGKLLDAFGGINFTNKYVSERVDTDRIGEMKLPGQAAVSTEVAERLATFPFDFPNHVIVRVCDEQILLLGIFGNNHLVHAAADRGVEGSDRHR